MLRNEVVVVTLSYLKYVTLPNGEPTLIPNPEPITPRVDQGSWSHGTTTELNTWTPGLLSRRSYAFSESLGCCLFLKDLEVTARLWRWLIQAKNTRLEAKWRLRTALFPSEPEPEAPIRKPFVS